MATDVDQIICDIQRDYLEFLDNDDDYDDQSLHQQKVRDMIKKDENRLIVNINDIRRNIPQRAKGLLN